MGGSVSYVCVLGQKEGGTWRSFLGGHYSLSLGRSALEEGRERCLGPKHSICRLSVTPMMLSPDDLLLSSADPPVSRTDPSPFQFQGCSVSSWCGWGADVGFHSLMIKLISFPLACLALQNLGPLARCTCLLLHPPAPHLLEISCSLFPLFPPVLSFFPPTPPFFSFEWVFNQKNFVTSYGEAGLPPFKREYYRPQHGR